LNLQDLLHFLLLNLPAIIMFRFLLDLDFRADQWHDPRAYGVTARAFLTNCKMAIGTEEEILATMLKDPSQIKITNQQISAPEITGNINEAIKAVLKQVLKH